MSEKSFTVRVKVGGNEIEISGTQTEVLGTLGDVSEIVRKVAEAFSSVPNQLVSGVSADQVHETARKKESEGYPSLALDPSITCPEAITKLLSTDWGKKQPRSLGEILEAMKVNAIHYPEGTVKGRLTDLTKRGILRRIKGDRGYEYILVKP